MFIKMSAVSWKFKLFPFEYYCWVLMFYRDEKYSSHQLQAPDSIVIKQTVLIHLGYQLFYNLHS